MAINSCLAQLKWMHTALLDVARFKLTVYTNLGCMFPHKIQAPTRCTVAHATQETSCCSLTFPNACGVCVPVHSVQPPFCISRPPTTCSNPIGIGLASNPSSKLAGCKRVQGISSSRAMLAWRWPIALMPPRPGH